MPAVDCLTGYRPIRFSDSLDVDSTRRTDGKKIVSETHFVLSVEWLQTPGYWRDITTSTERGSCGQKERPTAARSCEMGFNFHPSILWHKVRPNSVGSGNGSEGEKSASKRPWVWVLMCVLCMRFNWRNLTGWSDTR